MDEAKHKEKLITELDKVEATFKAISKSNINGRVIDYGNGVSIDTDDVIDMSSFSKAREILIKHNILF